MDQVIKLRSPSRLAGNICYLSIRILLKLQRSKVISKRSFEIFGIYERKQLIELEIMSSNDVNIDLMSRTEYRISLTEDTIKDPTDLRKNVKRILGVIIGLLKDRVSASEEPANKKRRVEEIIKKK